MKIAILIPEYFLDALLKLLAFRIIECIERLKINVADNESINARSRAPPEERLLVIHPSGLTGENDYEIAFSNISGTIDCSRVISSLEIWQARRAETVSYI